MSDGHDFATFMDQHVNLSPVRLHHLEGEVDELRMELWQHRGFRSLEPRLVVQGSWAQRTMVSPGPGGQFDIDLLVCRKSDPRWRRQPAEYLHDLYRMVASSVGNHHVVQLKTRCVEISLSDHHVDLVPYVMRPLGGVQPHGYIVNRRENCFERVSPEGFTEWFRANDDITGRHLRAVMRLLKFARAQVLRLDVPSAILTILLAGRVDRRVAAAGGYRNVPVALGSLMRDLDRWLAVRTTIPRLPDPSCRGAGFEHRLTPELYSGLRAWAAEVARISKYALRSCDHHEQAEHWRRLLGDDFGR